MFLCVTNLEIRSVELAFDYLKSPHFEISTSCYELIYVCPCYYDCHKFIFECIYDLLISKPGYCSKSNFSM